MSGVMIDTSAYSALGRGHLGIRDALRIAPAIYVSPIVLGELLAGFRAGTRMSENPQLRRFFASPRVSTAAIGEDTALCYAQILRHLRGTGSPIPTNDLWIAAAAMEHGLTVLTTDTHFRAVPRIRLDYYGPQS